MTTSTWVAPEISRTDEPTHGAERESLEGWLRWHRATLLFKCQGLTGEELCRRSVEPSSLSLLGLVRHMAHVERAWFRIRVSGQKLDPLYVSEGNPDGEFDDADPSRAEEDFNIYREECALADDATRGHSLDETFEHRGYTFDLRWVYNHMIEEYARHNGHADLLRERIDGATGD